MLRAAVGSRRRTDGDRAADTTLALLNAEVREKNAEDVLGADGFGDVAERVDGRSSDRLLVRLEEVEELKANTATIVQCMFDSGHTLEGDSPHPLAGGDELGSAVGDTSDQVDGRLLHLFVSVPENRSHARN